ALLDDLAGDLGTAHRRLADRHVAALSRRYEEHLVEHDRRALVARELLDHHGLARLDAILLTTRLDHGVHDNLRKRLSESGTLQMGGKSSSEPCRGRQPRSSPEPFVQ